ncbi:MAG: ComF family protein [Elusimicrobiales bacterium]|nr:ComF family protein [Elusimicrobiales bacterium]
MKSGIIKAGKWLLNALLPRPCAHCGLDLHYLESKPLCPGCTALLEPLPELRCEVCGLPLDDGGRACRDCRGGAPRSLALARSAFVFNPQLRSLVHTFKYRAREDLAVFLAAEMADAFTGFPELAPYNFSVAVPLHPAKRRERGFNQAELLAAALAAHCNLFHLKDVSTRTRNTRSQTTLSKEKRKANISGAFAVAKPELVKGRNILLVDDVATTLATLDELASELKKAGARSVAAYTLAREP